MTPPPTSIDGTDITGATIDGQDAGEIPIDGQTVFAKIPGSVVLQYFGDTYQQGSGVWVDDNGNEDMTLSGNPQSTTLSDGSDALLFDGSDDHGLSTLPGSLTGSGFNQFSVEGVLEYTGTRREAWFGVTDFNNTPLLFSRTNEDNDFNITSGKLSVLFRDANDNRLVIATTNDEGLNDGTRHNITIKVNDASSADIEIIIDGTSVPISTNSSQNDNLTSFSSLNFDTAFGARNDAGTITDRFNGKIGAIRWHDTNSGQTIGSF